MRLKTLLFGTATTDSPAADLGLLCLRVIAGLSLALAHGLGKVPLAGAGRYTLDALIGGRGGEGCGDATD